MSLLNLKWKFRKPIIHMELLIEIFFKWNMGNILTCNKLVNEDREQRDLKRTKIPQLWKEKFLLLFHLWGFNILWFFFLFFVFWLCLILLIDLLRYTSSLLTSLIYLLLLLLGLRPSIYYFIKCLFCWSCVSNYPNSSFS